ncbi:helix-turn-helix transcriptional regulator [Scytonema tolypothrichoides VB-61278]|nr:helix-turn-helix transcriptional regulator [Scytonema tolypothrichoides VB-61278]
MSSQPRIHPSDTIKNEWVLSSQTLYADGLAVEHQVQPSGECEAPGGLTHHVLAFELGNVPRQVSRIGGREYDGPLLQGEILLIPAEAALFGACETSDEILAFIIDPIFLHQVALQTNCRYPDQIELFNVLKTYDPQIEFIALSVQREIQQAIWGSRLYLNSLANMLAIHLLRNYTSCPPKLREYDGGLTQLKLHRVLEFINTNLEQDIQLADLADAADMSQCYFVNLFKQSMGITPWQYVVQQRVERAKVLLKQHNSPISDVALQCGFNSQSHFTLQFRKLTGVTPKRFRGN